MQPEIIEFAAQLVDLQSGEVEHEYATLIRPSQPLPPEHMKYTPISNEMLATAPVFKQVAERIRTLIESSPVVIAHNLNFDREMVDMEFERLGQTPLAWPLCLCTIEQTMHLKGYRLSMEAIHEHLFGEKFKDAHRASVDVNALVRCCVKLHKEEVL
jgi:DNA polymerase III epsilon subunit-like protein